MRVQELDLRSVDHVLTTTRAVRQRLDLEQEVPLDVVRECLEIALQAPTGFNLQDWRWIVVTDPERKRRIGDLFRRAEHTFVDMMDAEIPEDDLAGKRIVSSCRHLAEHLHEVPVLVIPCTTSKVSDTYGLFEHLKFETDLWNMAASAVYGGIWPAAWNFMLALRSRGLGSSLTMIHLGHEPEIARILEMPDGASQAGLIPVAWFTGDDFQRGPRRPVHEVTYYDQWGQTRPPF